MQNATALPNQFIKTVTVKAKSPAEARALAQEQFAGEWDNALALDVERTYEVKVMYGDNPLTDRSGSPINVGDRVLFTPRGGEGQRIGTVTRVHDRHEDNRWVRNGTPVEVTADDSGYLNRRPADALIVLPANLDADAKVTDPAVQRIVAQRVLATI